MAIKTRNITLAFCVVNSKFIPKDKEGSTVVELCLGCTCQGLDSQHHTRKKIHSSDFISHSF